MSLGIQSALYNIISPTLIMQTHIITVPSSSLSGGSQDYVFTEVFPSRVMPNGAGSLLSWTNSFYTRLTTECAPNMKYPKRGSKSFVFHSSTAVHWSWLYARSFTLSELSQWFYLQPITPGPHQHVQICTSSAPFVTSCRVDGHRESDYLLITTAVIKQEDGWP